MYLEDQPLTMKRMVSDRKAAKLTHELKELETYNNDELKKRWRSLFGTQPPPKIDRSLLLAAIAHRMQENVLGALKSAVRRQLMQAAHNSATPRPSANSLSRRPRAGTILVRDWGGVTHQAQVLEGGILFRNQHYPSLSAVARVITGARWSGPRFFGLRAAFQERIDGTR